MADPLTAFATAGTVLQVVDFGSKLLGLAIQYAKDGGVTEVASIESYVNTLIAANQQLQESLETSDNLVQPGSARALSIANKQCLAISQELVAVLQSLKLTKLTWWSFAKTALRAHKAQPKLQELRSRLESCKSNLSVCFMAYTLQQDPKHNYHENRRESGAGRIQKEMQTIRQKWITQPGLAEDIEDLAQKLQESSIHHDFDAELKSIANLHVFAVKDVSAGLKDSFRVRNSEIKNLDQDMEQLTSKINHETRTRNLLLESLSFPEMNDRLFNVKRAHDQTYSWIFDNSDNISYNESNFIEWLCDRNGSSLYWIRGKAGSGKSTMLREIFEELSKDQDNRSWRSSKTVFIATCFFWYAGTVLQRSFQGLLQTLIYQILQANPDLIYQTVGHQKWQQAWNVEHGTLHWSITELKNTLLDVVHRFENIAALLLLIDGLDEFQGDDEERLDMVEFLALLTEKPWVKICVSSRPWNVYKDAFEDCPQIRLENLTRVDIETFVQDTFTADKLFMRKTARDPDLLQRLMSQIADNAEGVFLWVRLVIRDLLKSIRDGSSPQHLFRVLENMPRDLDEYFGRMMDQMDPSYKNEASILFKLKLNELSNKPSDDEDPALGPPLRVLDLIHLDRENLSDYFVLDDDYKPSDFVSCSLEILKEQFDSLERRIASRSMGLLETAQHLWDRRGLIMCEVNFLHRTVKDFLCTPSAQDKLDHSLQTPFNAAAFRCTSMVDRLITLGPSHHRQAFDSDSTIILCISCFLQSVQRPDIDQDKMVKVYQRAIPTISLCINLKAFGSELSPFKRWIGDKIEVYEELHLAIAIQQGWKYFIDHVLEQSDESQRKVDCMLDLALRPLAGAKFLPSHEMVAYILSLGANPNSTLSELITTADHHGASDHRSSPVPFQRGPLLPEMTIWTQFLLDFRDEAGLSSTLRQTLITTMVEAGSSHYLPNQAFVGRHEKPDSSLTSSKAGKAGGIGDDMICSLQCPDHQPGNDVHLLQHLKYESSKFRGHILRICKERDLERTSC